MIEQLNAFSAAWALLMANIAWQAALLAAAVGALCWLLRRESPSLRYFLWLALSLKLLLLPLWSIQLPAPAWFSAPLHSELAPTLASAPGLVASAASRPAAQLPIPNPAPTSHAALSSNSHQQSFGEALSALTLPAWLFILWLTVILAAITRIARQLRSLRRLIATTSVADDAEQIVVEQCAARLALAQLPDVRIIAGDGSPMVCGLRRPTLILPSELVAQIDAPALQQIILHELAHLKRRDLLTIWVIQTLRMAYWFNPVVHWIAYRAGLERELACDRLAMLNSGANATTYARTLIDAASSRTQPLVLNAATAARLTG